VGKLKLELQTHSESDKSPYGPGTRKAATSRRTPKRAVIVHQPVVTRTFNCTRFPDGRNLALPARMTVSVFILLLSGAILPQEGAIQGLVTDSSTAMTMWAEMIYSEPSMATYKHCALAVKYGIFNRKSANGAKEARRKRRS